MLQYVLAFDRPRVLSLVYELPNHRKAHPFSHSDTALTFFLPKLCRRSLCQHVSSHDWSETLDIACKISECVSLACTMQVTVHGYRPGPILAEAQALE
jgi:hypothetical protein